MSGTYVIWPPPASSGGASGPATTIAFSIGSMDGQASSVNGASVSSSSIFMQSASNTASGLVNITTQTFAGQKTFASNIVSSSQVLLASGSAANPSLGFSNQPGAGWYLIGSGDIGLSNAGNLAIEVLAVGSQFSFGFGASAVSARSSPLTAQANYNQTAFFQYANNNTGSASAAVLQCIAGTNGANSTNLENWAQLLSGYLAGGSALFSGPFQTQMNIGVEATSETTTYLAFNINGRTLATEKMRLNPSNLTLNGGLKFVLTGSSTGAPTLTQLAATSGSNYTITWPGNAGITGQALLYGSAGALSWGGLNSMVGSVSLTNQVVGNLPLSQTSGSISLTNQVVNNLPLSQTSGSISLTNQVVNNLPLSQTSGSISLTNQVVNNLPLSQTSGSVTFNQMQTMPQLTIGSITQTSSTGGALMTVTWPGSYGAPNQALSISSAGFLSWQTPSAVAVTGSVTQTSSVGGAAYTISWPGAQGSNSTIPTNDGAGHLSWQYPGPLYSAITAATNLAINTWYSISSASATMSLPDATTAGYKGKAIYLTHNGISLSQKYILATVASQTISGVISNSYILTTNGEQLTLFSDGSNWQAVDHNTNTSPQAFTPAWVGIGTVGSNSAFWVRRGSICQINFMVTCGTVLAEPAIMPLPAGMSISSNIPVNNGVGSSTAAGTSCVIGYARSNAGASAEADMLACLNTSNTQIYGGAVYSASSNVFAPPNAGAAGGIFGNASVVQGTVEFPVPDWQP